MGETYDQDLWMSFETRGSMRWGQQEDQIQTLADMPTSEAWRFILPALLKGGYSMPAALELRRQLWEGRRLELNARRHAR